MPGTPLDVSCFLRGSSRVFRWVLLSVTLATPGDRVCFFPQISSTDEQNAPPRIRFHAGPFQGLWARGCVAAAALDLEEKGPRPNPPSGKQLVAQGGVWVRHSSVTGRGGVVPRLIGPGRSWHPEPNFVVRDCCGRYIRLSSV